MLFTTNCTSLSSASSGLAAIVWLSRPIMTACSTLAVRLDELNLTPFAQVRRRA